MSRALPAPGAPAPDRTPPRLLRHPDLREARTGPALPAGARTANGLGERRAPNPSLRSAVQLATFILAGALALGAGPAGADPGPAEQALEAWRAAVEHGDAATAWALLTDEARAGHTPATFRDAFDAERESLLRQARSWDGATVTERAEVPVGLVLLRLVRTPEGWRVDGPPEARATEARAAAGVAARLLRARALDGVRRLALTEATEAALEARMDAAATALEALAAAPEEPAGDEATATLPDGSTIRLVRTADGWRIDGLAWLAAP